MENKQGFTGFGWALALFCLPTALWPLALLVSPGFSDSRALTGSQINWFSTLFWIYPAILLTISGVLLLLSRSYKKLAKVMLVLAFVGFYATFFYIFKTAF